AHPVVALAVEVGLPPQHIAVREGHGVVAVVVRGVAALLVLGVLNGVGEGAVAIVHVSGLAGKLSGKPAWHVGQQSRILVEAAGIIDVIAEGGAPAEIPAHAVAALEGEVEAHARWDGEPEAGIVLQLGGQLAQLVELAGVVDLPLGLAEVYGGAYIGEEPEI